LEKTLLIMENILKKYKKEGVITTGSDNVKLDTPEFEIIDVKIDTVNRVLSVEIMHEVKQGSLTQKQSRRFDVAFGDLSSSIQSAGLSFLQAIETKILELPQYSGSTEV